uniref:RING-CH-type domain-containing protein n=1 Tax=Nelumbo nucifera TaxID=4432 RepID=A0A822XUZ1_NELNU|nr:TPA_asm: hypothetical protein HUJ06_022731 [Nelumbo nucifera]
MDKEICDRQGVVENSLSSQTDPAPQTVIVIAPAEDESANGECGGSKAKDNVLETSKVSLELEKHTCVIGVKCGGEFSGETWEGEKACRICHLSSVSDYPSEVPSDLITLGCGCKGELGIAHRHCAEAWFKLRGNRISVFYEPYNTHQFY